MNDRSGHSFRFPRQMSLQKNRFLRPKFFHCKTIIFTIRKKFKFQFDFSEKCSEKFDWQLKKHDNHFVLRWFFV